MEIKADVDIVLLTSSLQGLRNGPKRIAWAVALGINETLKRVQTDEQVQFRRAFTVRKPAFLFGTPEKPGGAAARIRPFANANQNRLWGEIHTGQASTQRGQRGLLIPKYEEGGTREPVKGKYTNPVVAIAITGGPARPTMKDSIVKGYDFRGLKLTAYRKRQAGERKRKRGYKAFTLFDKDGHMDLRALSQGGVQMKGRNRTFLIKTKKGTRFEHGAILQRTGPGATRLVWLFKPNVKIDPHLEFRHTARVTANRWLKDEIEKQVRATIEYHNAKWRRT